MLLDTRNDIPPPGQPTNTFIALRPPWLVAEQFHARATQLCSNARIAGSRRPFSILHITVLPIGGFSGRLPRAFLKHVDAAISMVRFPAFEIVLEEAGSFETKRDHAPFVLQGYEQTDVCALRLITRDSLHVKSLNIPVRAAYSPHMTLAYSRRRAPRMKVDPFSWKAREFQLIESWVGRTKYVELARWSLRDDDLPHAAAQPARPTM